MTLESKILAYEKRVRSFFFWGGGEGGEVAIKFVWCLNTGLYSHLCPSKTAIVAFKNGYIVVQFYGYRACALVCLGQIKQKVTDVFQSQLIETNIVNVTVLYFFSAL